MGWDSSVGIATRFGLDVPGSNPGGGENFPHPSRPAKAPTQLPIEWLPRLSRGVKRPGRGVDHPPPFSAEVKERIELYLYSPSGTSWPVQRWALPLPLPLTHWQTKSVITKSLFQYTSILLHKTGTQTHAPRFGILLNYKITEPTQKINNMRFTALPEHATARWILEHLIRLSGGPTRCYCYLSCSTMASKMPN